MHTGVASLTILFPLIRGVFSWTSQNSMNALKLPTQSEVTISRLKSSYRSSVCSGIASLSTWYAAVAVSSPYLASRLLNVVWNAFSFWRALNSSVFSVILTMTTSSTRPLLLKSHWLTSLTRSEYDSDNPTSKTIRGNDRWPNWL